MAAVEAGQSITREDTEHLEGTATHRFQNVIMNGFILNMKLESKSISRKNSICHRNCGEPCVLFFQGKESVLVLHYFKSKLADMTYSSKRLTVLFMISH